LLYGFIDGYGFGLWKQRKACQFSNCCRETAQPGLPELEQSRKDYVQELLIDLFDFKPIQRSINYLLKLWEEHSSIMLGTLDSGLKNMNPLLKKELIEVASKFELQLKHLIASASDPEANSLLQERIRKAAEYFSDKFETLIHQPFKELTFETDNKTVRKSFNDAADKLRQEMSSKKICLDLSRNGFSIKLYLETKSKSAIEATERSLISKIKEESHSFSLHPDFYSKLKRWRQKKADELDVEISRILPQKTIKGIADNLPATKIALKAVKGMGGTRLQEFGKELLEMVIAYRKDKGMELPINVEREIEKAGLDSKGTSFDLFNSGKSILEIASERKMAVSTIEGHLAHFVGTGELDLDRVVAPEERKAIVDYVEKHKPETMSEIFNALGNKYGYSQIKFVLKYLEALRENAIEEI
jgi:hypothetical protein